MTQKPSEHDKPSRNYVDAASQTPREENKPAAKNDYRSPQAQRALSQVNEFMMNPFGRTPIMQKRKTFGAAKGKKNATKSGTLKQNKHLTDKSQKAIEENAQKEA